MKWCVSLLIILAATQVFAAGPLQKTKPGSESIQGFSTNGTLTEALTVASVTKDLTSDTAYSVRCGVDAYIRLMPTLTSTKANYVQFKVLADERFTDVVSSPTGFANISGCTSGDLRRMRP